jgi:hypothetical protein
MTACAIMQPTYLPWAGYFNLMATADVFVMFDDAQFQRGSWHCRNQIVLAGAATLLTVPVIHARLETKLNEVQIDYSSDWRKSHENRMRQAYARTPGGPLILDALLPAWLARPDRLIDLNLTIIASLAKILGVHTPHVMASELGILGQRSSRLMGICAKIGAKHYLSPAGSAEYLEDDGFANQSSVTLHLQNFVPQPYSQYRAMNFVPFMSVVDVIANLGAEAAAAYVRQPAFANFFKEPR